MGQVLQERTVESKETRPSLHFVLFYHSIISDWNNGNAHFLRGIVRELTQLGHYVTVYEPRNGWSITNLEADCDCDPEAGFNQYFPDISFVRYNPEHLHLDEVLETADVAIVHEWNEHSLVAEIGRHHAKHPHYALLFHDTHHRSVTDPAAMSAYDLENYDGVLAFGNVVRDLYLSNSWARRAWTFHEAADTQLFYPREPAEVRSDILWIGNWGDEERTAELYDYFIRPAQQLNLNCSAYGVRYPAEALPVLREAGVQYCGWLANYRVPDITAHYKMMIHIPRRPYVEALPGIPTIRPFEALACGIPLVSTYWNDEEQLFTAGEDYLLARSPQEMCNHIRAILSDRELARRLALNGLDTVRSRHTCAHRVRELMRILEELDSPVAKKIGRLCTSNQP